MESSMNHFSLANKKFTESRIMKFIWTLWFVAVKLPLQLIRALFSRSTGEVGMAASDGSGYQYQTMSLTEVMTESYLMEELSPLETPQKYARLFYSPTLGLVVSLIVFGTVMRLNFFRKNAHFIANGSGKYNKSINAPRRRPQLDLENIPIDYDEELGTWCTVDCSKVSRQAKEELWTLNDIPSAGLPKRVNNYAALAARSLIFSASRDWSVIGGPHGESRSHHK